MKKTTAIAMFLAVAAGTASAGAAITLSGSDTLETMTKRIIATCPASVGVLTGVTYGGGGSGTGENAMKAGTQQVSPMSRFFASTSTSGACGANQAKAEGMEIAEDGLAVLVSPTASAQCQGTVSTGGLAQTSTISVQNPGGADTTYTFTDWKDVLRTLYAGRDQAHPNTVAADCNSNVRKSLQKSWAKLFQASCGATPCTELKHLWTRGNLSGTTDTFLSLTSLPGVTKNSSGVVTATPMCSGLDYEDKDPIRVPCDANDDVCGADGTLGLVQTIFVPESLTTDVAYPVRACDVGVYNWVPAPNVTLDTCPGGGINVFTLCLMPGFNDPTATGGINHSCLKREAADAPFFTPISTNTLVYNQYLRNPNGSLVIDAENREISGAWYRIRSRTTTACREGTATRQIGCLAAQYNCSLGFAGQEAEQLGATGLFVKGTAATPANVLSRAYPLARGLFFNSIKGFENVTNVVSGNTTNELNLALCFGDNATTNAAATFAGFLPVNAVDPAAKIKCVDFNETVCGATTNANACSGNPTGIPSN